MLSSSCCLVAVIGKTPHLFPSAFLVTLVLTGERDELEWHDHIPKQHAKENSFQAGETQYW
jgi:hypothetical protein